MRHLHRSVHGEYDVHLPACLHHTYAIAPRPAAALLLVLFSQAALHVDCETQPRDISQLSHMSYRHYVHAFAMS